MSEATPRTEHPRRGGGAVRDLRPAPGPGSSTSPTGRIRRAGVDAAGGEATALRLQVRPAHRLDVRDCPGHHLGQLVGPLPPCAVAFPDLAAALPRELPVHVALAGQLKQHRRPRPRRRGAPSSRARTARRPRARRRPGRGATSSRTRRSRRSSSASAPAGRSTSRAGSPAPRARRPGAVACCRRRTLPGSGCRPSPP